MPRLLLLEDDDFVRLGVQAAIESLGFDVISAGTAAHALALAKTTPPAVAMLDIHLGRGPNGIDVAHALRKQQPDVGIVMLTSLDDPRLIGEHRGLPRGAVYLPKQSVRSVDEYRHAIALATDVKSWQAAEVSGGAFRALTSNQIELLRLVAAGHTNAEIAEAHGQREKSVESAVTRLVRDLGMSAQGGRVRLELAKRYFSGLGIGYEASHLD